MIKSKYGDGRTYRQMDESTSWAAVAAKNLTPKYDILNISFEWLVIFIMDARVKYPNNNPKLKFEIWVSRRRDT